MDASATGYSGTPLAKKLGIKEGTCVLVRNPPADYIQWLAPLPPSVVFVRTLTATTTVVHLFVTRREVLEEELAALRSTIRKEAAVWVSWPKKSAKISTDITEGTIREVALPIGFVDVKVCAVTEVWSGLKLYIRQELR